jgi:nitrous oxide reductase
MAVPSLIATGDPSMTRYYFYQADLYVPEENDTGVDRYLGSNHGVYAVGDDATPDLIFEQIIKGLADDADAQYQENAKRMNIEPEPNRMYYVMKQFNKVE